MSDAEQETSAAKMPPRAAIDSGLFAASLLLTVTLLAVFPLFAWYGHERSGMSGVWAAGVAGIVCWLGALAALLLVGATRNSPNAVNATLLSTGLRLGIPFLAGFILHRGEGELARGGVFGMILCYYLVALIVETILSVRLIGGKRPTAVKA